MNVSRGPFGAVLAVALVATTMVGLAGSPAAAAPPKCNGEVATIVGTAGDDILEGTPSRDVIVGLQGDDTIYGYQGNDLICGDGGNDTIYGGPGHDRLRGGTGADVLYGQRGNDRLFGQKGVDTLRGGIWADVCRGEDERNCEVDYRGERNEELWRDLVDQYFGDIGQTDNALTIIACESNGDPFAVNPNGSKPKGLWQFIPSTWDWVSPMVGWGNEIRFHPEAATASARWLYDWADAQAGGKGFDPWTHCRCLIPEYNCPFDTTALDD